MTESPQDQAWTTGEHGEVEEPPHPLRGLDWLLDLWVARIVPQVPGAELHIYAGPAVYGGVSGETAHAAQMEAVLARADALHAQGVHRHAPVGRDKLAEFLAAARVML